MANKVFKSFFTSGGAPAVGLSPTIDVYEVDTTVGGSNTLVVTGGAVVDSGGGWYRYDFTTYDYLRSYVFTMDGGAALGIGERYQVGGKESYQEEIWEESTATHLTVGTTGYLLNQIGADATQIRIDTTSAIALISTLLKYQTNRTKIDVVAMTLTIYDDDNTTPITVFDLRDDLGDPSITTVCERFPQ